MKRYLISLSFLSILFFTATKTALSQDYTLDGGVIPNASNITADTPLTPAPKAAFHGLFKGNNYSIQVGFEEMENESPILLRVSENLIDYGELSPTDPVTRVNNISASGASVWGFTIQAFENGQLKHDTSSFIIPDTTCDNGICTFTTAQPWIGALTYGFGYRCDPGLMKNFCSRGFKDPNSYKQFAKEVSPQIIAAGAHDLSAQITYKANISGSQAPQFYSNTITFIVVPNF